MTSGRQSLFTRPDLWSGAVLAALAAIVWLGTGRLAMGTLRAMGPGFFPRVLAVCLASLAIILVGKSLLAPGPPLTHWRPMPGLTVALSVGIFGVLVERAGLPIAVFACGAVAGLAGDDRRPRELALYAAGAAAVSVVLFVWLLGVRIPVMPWLN